MAWVFQLLLVWRTVLALMLCLLWRWVFRFRIGMVSRLALVVFVLVVRIESPSLWACWLRVVSTLRRCGLPWCDTGADGGRDGGEGGQAKGGRRPRERGPAPTAEGGRGRGDAE